MRLSRDELIKALPYGRRYARALSGTQSVGDGLVADGLRSLMEHGAPADDDLEPRHALFAVITQSFMARPIVDHGSTPPVETALAMDQRILLLLNALENVPVEAAARIMHMTPEEAFRRLREARHQLRSAAATDVLIIEDEPIIAMDIEELVQSCGHNVVGVAASESEAVAIAAKHPPGLILADINLGLGGDGAAAVARIVKHLNVPVIFVTAYPERLLTGQTGEPAFIITKPFEPATLAIATYQAVTGGVVLA